MSGRPDRLREALRLIELGYLVLPFYAPDEGGKQPARKQLLRVPCEDHPLNRNSALTAEELKVCRDCKGGVRAATANPRYLRWMWKKVGREALVGVVPPPGTVALDDDSGVWDGDWVFLPHVRSASGKAHKWYRLAEGQELWSENGILFTEPDGKVDMRTDDGSLFIGIPAGSGKYEAVNGWSPDPATWPVLDDETYQRLLSAPRSAGGGGGVRAPGEGFRRGLPEVPIGGPYDRVEGVCEELLETAGWTWDQGDHWTRPGKDAGTSGSLLQVDGVTFFNCFTSSAEPLGERCYYTASSLHCALLDGGDWELTREVLCLLDGSCDESTPEEDFGVIEDFDVDPASLDAVLVRWGQIARRKPWLMDWARRKAVAGGVDPALAQAFFDALKQEIS